MDGDPEERMVRLLTAMLGEMERLRVNAEAIRDELAETGRQLAELIGNGSIEIIPDRGDLN